MIKWEEQHLKNLVEVVILLLLILMISLQDMILTDMHSTSLGSQASMNMLTVDITTFLTLKIFGMRY